VIVWVRKRKTREKSRGDRTDDTYDSDPPARKITSLEGEVEGAGVLAASMAISPPSPFILVGVLGTD
jgi:hypothetical protein